MRRLAVALAASVLAALWGAPAFAADGPDMEIIPPAGPIVINADVHTASVIVYNHGASTAPKVEVSWNVGGLDSAVVRLNVGANPCPRLGNPNLFGPCPFPSGPKDAGTEVGFTVFTLTPVPGKSGPAGSLTVTVKSTGDPDTSNNSVTVPVEVQAPPASPTPTVSPSPSVPSSPPATPIPAPTPTAGSGGGLPITGTQAATAGWAGLAVLVLGALLFVVARRRRVVVVAPDDEL